MSVKQYRELIVWQKAMDLVCEVYRLVKLLPKEEMYALSDQMRRAAISIPSNIAEGHSRNSSAEFVRFLSIARGSNAEVETQLELCVRLGYVAPAQIVPAKSLADEIGRMITSIMGKLSSRPNPSPLTPHS